jgi:2,3-bisphosphoglycerate-independent phosphoglycerate mutase
VVKDRRAGRISTTENRRLCRKIRDNTKVEFDGELYVETVSEHRAVLVLRGEDLGGELGDTDPHKTGVQPLAIEPLSDKAAHTAEIVREFLDQVQDALASEDRANMILLRGFDSFHALPSLQARFHLRGVCSAQYPMYKGISRLVGMEVLSSPSMEGSFKELHDVYGDDFDFYFLHLKKTDSSGENEEYGTKVETIETIDRWLPTIIDLKPDVLVVTADHSTPAIMGQHSWHPVPFCIHSPLTRGDGTKTFDEPSCRFGALGIRPGLHLMGLALAQAGRLKKFA